MNKQVAVIAAALLSVVAFCFLSRKTTAQATDASFGAEVEMLTEDQLQPNSPYLEASPNLQPGDYMVTLYIHDNPGFDGLGINVTLDSNYEFYYHQVTGAINADCYEREGYQYTGNSIYYNLNQNKAGTALFTPGSPYTTSGAIFSIFAKRKANAPQVLPQVTVGITLFHNDEVSIPYSINTTTLYSLKYILGDINGDGIVDTDDASILLQILSQYGTITSANAQQAFAGCAGMFCDGIFILDAADANQDSGVTQQDSSAILSYYNYVMLELPYSGDIGTCLTYVYTV